MRVCASRQYRDIIAAWFGFGARLGDPSQQVIEVWLAANLLLDKLHQVCLAYLVRELVKETAEQLIP